MKGISKLLLGLGAGAVMVLASMPIAEAQCVPTRTLGAGGGGGASTRVKVTGPAGFTTGAGNELASIWDQSAAGTTNNGGFHFTGADSAACPAQGAIGWLITGGMFLGTDVGVEAFIGSSNCLWSICPSDLTITAIELASDDGSDAAFIAFTVDETPADVYQRWWSHARVTGANGDANDYTYELVRFPTVDVVSSAGPVPDTTLTSNYADLALNVESAAGAGDSPLPGSATIASYDIMQATGTADPGRARGGYTLIKSVPYGDAAVSGDTVAVPCAGPGGDTYVAVGVTYAGGVESELVGAATPVECDPAIANPDGKDDLRDRKIRPNRRSIRRSR